MPPKKRLGQLSRAKTALATAEKKIMDIEAAVKRKEEEHKAAMEVNSKSVTYFAITPTSVNIWLHVTGAHMFWQLVK